MLNPPSNNFFRLTPELRQRLEALLAKPMEASTYEESTALGEELNKVYTPYFPRRTQAEIDDALLIDRIVAARLKYESDTNAQKLYFEKLQAGMAMALEAAHFLGGHLQISYQPKRSVEPKES
jgi:hypothetical protein